MATMTDQDKLRALLPHWIEHNDEHAAESRNWAEKARATGQEEVAEEIALAAQPSWRRYLLQMLLDRQVVTLTGI